MADALPPLGVTAEVPTPPKGLPSPVPVPAAPEPPLWSPAAQWCTAALLGLSIALLGWRGIGLTRHGTQPLAVEESLPAIDLNRADPADLELLPGVGPTLARRIVADRQRNGRFRSVEDLRRVPGVGPATLERLEPFLVVDSPTEAPAAPPPPRVVRGARPEGPSEPKKPPPGAKIDLNTASRDELQKLPGVGPTLSARIVEARHERPFRSVDELRRVKGIGVKTLERVRPHVFVGEPPE
jgi:competence protein ComEA